MNVIVNWFTLLIVFVFDPLAISMVIALNKLTSNKKEEDEPKLDFNIDTETIENVDTKKTKSKIFASSTKVDNPKKDVTFVPTDEDAVKNLYGEYSTNQKIHKYRK
jgi:hypothetical protein